MSLEIVSNATLGLGKGLDRSNCTALPVFFSAYVIFYAILSFKLDETMFALVTGGHNLKQQRVFVTFIADETWHPKD
ncbi:MAG: hypothetical protein M3410_12220 [Acidobacteriota bacterium]|nr:hypothetical protein [Acidobacteriota bacterium]